MSRINFYSRLLTKIFCFIFLAKRRLSSSPSLDKPDATKCEHCGKVEKSKLKKKPYCSNACAKAAKLATNGPTTETNGDDKKIKSEPTLVVEPPAASPTSSTTTPTSSTPTSLKRTHSQTNGIIQASEAKRQALEVTADAEEQVPYLVKWTVEEVCDYIRNHSGYGDYADEFMVHEIDGQALLLLNENHLVQTMGIKLGPALKIMSKIEAIKNSAAPVEQ